MATDPEGARERLDAASAETERLQHVIDGLLALARADGEHAVELVDVSTVVRDRVGTWQPLAEESGGDIALAGRRGGGLVATVRFTRP